MPKNMKDAGMSYRIGGSTSAKKKRSNKNKMKMYNMGGSGMGGFTSSDDGMRDITPQTMAMETMAAGGGLDKFTAGGSVLDPMMGKMKKGGSTSKKDWIQGAVKKPGALTSYVKSEGVKMKDGKPTPHNSWVRSDDE